MNINAWLDSVGPYNVTNQTVIKDVLDIFIDFITTKSAMSIDLDKTYLGENPIIDAELVKIYLNDIYTILKKVQHNPEVLNALNQLSANNPSTHFVNLLTETTNDILATENWFNILFYSNNAIGSDVVQGTIDSIPTDTLKEYIYTAKAFKQRKGTVSALKYGYNVVRQSGIQKEGTTDANIDTLFDVQYGTEENPNEPFYFRITGSLIPEVYLNAVVPIVHPLGFGYDYIRLMKLAFLELGLVKEQQSNYNIRIVCNNGAYEYIIPSNDITYITKEYNDFGDLKITVALKLTSDLALANPGYSAYKIVRDYNTFVYLQDQDDVNIIVYPEFCALFTNYDIKYISGILETEKVDIFCEYGTEVVPQTIDTNFDIDIWCIGDTYFLSTEDDNPIVTETLGWNLITCSA